MDLPDPQAFADAMLAVASRLPQGGGYRFTPASREAASVHNPRDPHHDGVSRSLSHDGEVFARAADDGVTYCCGVTLEAFWTAWTRWCGEHGQAPLPADADPAELVSLWFCPTMGHAGAADAIVKLGIGFAVDPSEARRGDLCQFWRSVDLTRPSGHSVVFLGWGARRGKRTIRYWSSQPATQGIGEHEEEVGPQWSFAFARVGQRSS